MRKRVILIVLDSVGIGEMPDANEFGDKGSNTLGNIYKIRGNLTIPNLRRLGMGRLVDLGESELDKRPVGNFGKAMEVTKAKDTTSGHWELMGLIMKTPFKTFPNGFPKQIIDEFERQIGRKILGNVVASGTEIINQLAAEHVLTGKPIVYTSADSVFQIAAHEEVIPLDELYRYCRIARELFTGDNQIGRVIARPFIGSEGKYVRTGNRQDFALPPQGETVLDSLTTCGKTVSGVGKIEDIFHNRGITFSNHTKNNADSIDATLEFILQEKGDFIFTNLVDFDMLYGHRNDVEGYAAALEYFDSRLPEIQKALGAEDLLMITADHGCDPTTQGTDHSREFIPVLAAGAGFKQGTDIGVRTSFTDVGATILEYLTGKKWCEGRSFLCQIKK